MKKYLGWLFLLILLVGCSKGPTYYEQNKYYKINDQLEISFNSAYEHYYLPSTIIPEMPVSTYKMIEFDIQVSNMSSQSISDVSEVLDFSALVDGEEITSLITQESNRYGGQWRQNAIEISENKESSISLSLYLSPTLDWKEIILTENNSTQQWVINSDDVKKGYSYGSSTEVTFFDKKTTLGTIHGESCKFYGVTIEVNPDYEIIGITEDGQAIGLTQIKETDDDVITMDHVLSDSSHWYGSSLYPIKGYMVTNRKGVDVYYNRDFHSQEIKETHQHYISSSEIGIQTVEIDGETYQFGTSLSAVVYYKDGLIDKVDHYTLHFTELTRLPTAGLKGMQGSYQLSDDGTEAYVTYKFKFVSETDETDWVTLKGTIK